jgi:flagellar hook-associated protein 2
VSQFSISGAVSGVDTASIINSLVAVQQNQQKLLQTQQSKQQSAADTYGKLVTALAAVSTAAKSVAATSDWKGVAATSTAASVTPTATGNTASSITFDVTSVARAHTVISAESVSSLGASVASGPLTVTKGDGTTSTIAVGSGSLSDVVAAVNASGAGLRAAAVQTSPGQYRLQVSSTSTGAVSSFTVDGLDGFTGTNVLTQGTDATVTVGTNPATAYTATSPTNTFTSLVPGLSFTVSAIESNVTVSSSVDGSTVADDVQSLVDAANSVLTSIGTATSWNATTKTGGPLLGDSTARALRQSILTTVSGAGAAGVGLSRDGSITFDKAAFTTAFAKDPAAVAATFGATSSFAAASGVTGSVSFSSSTTSTRAGTYDVSITGRATTEQWDVGSPAAGSVVSFSRGTQSVGYTVGGSDTVDDVVAALNARSAQAGFGITASAGGSGILLTANAAGSASSFEATVDGNGATRTEAGSDVAGTIDGQTASGSGNVLSLLAGTGGAVGISLNVSVTDTDISASAGAVGSVTYAPGLAQQLSRLVDQQTTSVTGVLSSAKLGRESAVKSFQNQIDDWDRRLTAYRATLQTQFTAMETAIAALKSQATSITNFSNSSSSSSSSG